MANDPIKAPETTERKVQILSFERRASASLNWAQNVRVDGEQTPQAKPRGQELESEVIDEETSSQRSLPGPQEEAKSQSGREIEVKVRDELQGIYEEVLCEDKQQLSKLGVQKKASEAKNPTFARRHIVTMKGTAQKII